jgi:hypothetical protein
MNIGRRGSRGFMSVLCLGVLLGATIIPLQAGRARQRSSAPTSRYFLTRQSPNLKHSRLREHRLSGGIESAPLSGRQA